MKNENLLKVMLLPCFAFVASVAFGATEDFQDDTMDGTWTGHTTTSVQISAEALKAGNPHTHDVTAEGNQVLSYEGEVTWGWGDDTETGTAVDFLLNVTESADELSDPATDTRIALAVMDGKWQVWCMGKDEDATATWCDTDKVVAVSDESSTTWVRVTLKLSNNRCLVSIDGKPLVSAGGYPLATSTSGETGAWYPLATGESGAVTSVVLAGTAQADSFVVANEVAYPTGVGYDIVVEPATDGGYSPTVTMNDLNDWGLDIVTATTPSPDGSGMKVVDKLEVGFDPTKAEEVFEPKAMDFVTDNDGNLFAVVEFPAELANGLTFKVVDVNSQEIEGATATHDTDKKKVNVALPASEKTETEITHRILKFKVQATR